MSILLLSLLLIIILHIKSVGCPYLALPVCHLRYFQSHVHWWSSLRLVIWMWPHWVISATEDIRCRRGWWQWRSSSLVCSSLEAFFSSIWSAAVSIPNLDHLNYQTINDSNRFNICQMDEQGRQIYALCRTEGMLPSAASYQKENKVNSWKFHAELIHTDS